jgi:hypothetical protein
MPTCAAAAGQRSSVAAGGGLGAHWGVCRGCSGQWPAIWRGSRGRAGAGAGGRCAPCCVYLGVAADQARVRVGRLERQQLLQRGGAVPAALGACGGAMPGGWGRLVQGRRCWRGGLLALRAAAAVRRRVQALGPRRQRCQPRSMAAGWRMGHPPPPPTLAPLAPAPHLGCTGAPRASSSAPLGRWARRWAGRRRRWPWRRRTRRCTRRRRRRRTQSPARTSSCPRLAPPPPLQRSSTREHRSQHQPLRSRGPSSSPRQQPHRGTPTPPPTPAAPQSQGWPVLGQTFLPPLVAAAAPALPPPAGASSGAPLAAAMASSVYAAGSAFVKVLKASRMGR